MEDMKDGQYQLMMMMMMMMDNQALVKIICSLTDYENNH